MAKPEASMTKDMLNAKRKGSALVLRNCVMRGCKLVVGWEELEPRWPWSCRGPEYVFVSYFVK